MREQIKRLDELAAEQSQIENDLDERMQKIIRRYIDANHPTDRSYGFPGPTVSFDWEVRDGEVRVTWRELWSYGGNDEGQFDMPIIFACDPIALGNYERHRASVKEALRRDAEANARREKVLQIERLQKELG